MKKVLFLLLSVIMLFSVGIMGVSAKEEENLCKEFEELESFCLWYSPVSPFNVYTIVGWTGDNIPNLQDYYCELENEDGVYAGYKVPADWFDDYVNKYFALDEDFRTLVEKDKESEYQTITYEESTNEYAFSYGGYGFGPTYDYFNLMGYTKETDTYTVYISKLPELFDTLQDLLDYEGTTVEDWGDSLKSTEDGKYYIEIPKERQENYKLTVSFDGEIIKLLEGEKVDTIPDSSEMITPIEEPETPQIDYDTPEGIEIEGDTAFEEGTVVKVENVASGEIYERAEKSLNEIAENGKIAVFEFSATKDNATVQPNGKVKVSFALPSNLSADNLKMFYVATDGKTEEIAIIVDKDTKTVVAELEHFSTYVLLNTKTVPPTDSDTSKDDGTNIPQTGDTTNIALFAVLMFASLSALAVLTYTKKKQHNH